MSVRLILCVAHTANFLMCSLGNALGTPMHKSERQLRAAVRERWGSVVDGVTTGLQHLTICSLGLLCVYLFLREMGYVETAAVLAVIVLPLQTMVGVLYWSLVLYNPYLLFPRSNFPKDDQEADRVVRQFTIFPTWGQPALVFFFILMHLQHTVAPGHLWAEVYLGALPPSGLTRATEVSMALVAAAAYLGLNLFCWRVRGIPAYPFQAALASPGNEKLQLGFYSAAACLCAGSAAAGHALR